MNKTEYLLICLMEEAAEIQQIASKCLRFGLDNHHPDHPETTNRTELNRELIDLDAVHVMLMEAEALPIQYSGVTEMTPKTEKVIHWMGVSRVCGILTEAKDEELLREIAADYLDICDHDMCAGDGSVGIPKCPFHEYPDIDSSGKQFPGGCQIRRLVEKYEKEAADEKT